MFFLHIKLVSYLYFYNVFNFLINYRITNEVIIYIVFPVPRFTSGPILQTISMEGRWERGEKYEGERKGAIMSNIQKTKISHD